MSLNTHSLDLESTSSQYAWKDNPTNLDLTGDMTIELWCKPETLVAGRMTLVDMSFDAETEAENILFRVSSNSSGKIEWFHENSAGTNNIATSTAVQLANATWAHIAMVRDTANNVIKLYKNGAFVEDIAYTNEATGGSNADFSIGRNPVGEYWDGLIDEVRIWSDIRTAGEILANWKKDVTGQASLVGYWKLNNAYTDATGTNNLTAVNTPTFSTDVPFSIYEAVSNASFLLNFA